MGSFLCSSIFTQKMWELYCITIKVQHEISLFTACNLYFFSFPRTQLVVSGEAPVILGSAHTRFGLKLLQTMAPKRVPMYPLSLTPPVDDAHCWWLFCHLLSFCIINQALLLTPLPFVDRTFYFFYFFFKGRQKIFTLKKNVPKKPFPGMGLIPNPACRCSLIWLKKSQN